MLLPDKFSITGGAAMKKPRTLWEKKKDKPLIKAAMTLTKCDVQRFNQYTILLNQSQIPDAEKESMILFIREMCNALKILKDSFDEQKFCISYSHFFNGDKCHDLARDNYLDKSTVVKRNQQFILALSEILYPNLHFYNSKDGKKHDG